MSAAPSATTSPAAAPATAPSPPPSPRPRPGDHLGHTIDGNERGLKDTIRVNPREITEIAVRFTTYAGRYLYHCHILEHEDRDMMRPFVTTPAELLPFMA